MLKTALKDTYLGGTTTTTLKNEFATFRKIYYDKENQVMVNQLVNEFYTRLLFKIDKLPQELGFPLEISATFFNNLSPDVREFLISEGVQVPQILPTETNHQGNQRLLLVRNAALEAEKNTRTIKSAIQPAGGSFHHWTFTSMPGGIPSIKTADLSSSFQSEENNSTETETMEEYALASAGSDYENPGEQEPMGFMESGGEILGSENTPPCMKRKHSSFPSLTGTKNTNWETAAVYMSVDEEATRKATGGLNTPVEFWGCTNSPIYHAGRFHTYRNCPNKRDPDVAELENQSIQEYAQQISILGGIIGDKDSQRKLGQTY